MGGILLSAIAVSLLMALRSAPKTETKPKAQQSVYEMIKAKQANSDKEKEEAVSLEVEGRRKSQSQKTRNNSDAIANAFWENAMRRAEQQKQKNAEWSRFMNNLNRCKPCNGSGSYSYVDQFGNLKARTCPYCNGLGNNALIQNQLRR
ncbi:MAG: hypothetical protein HUJ26_13485 [Planctomycetaceae bacterium]|nr:hypothetical protein [Planctomycetaceae bacterium]